MKKKVYEPTIIPELFDTIKLLRRSDDARIIQENTGLSRPTIDKALNFGFIRDATLEKVIIEFYENRAKEQKEAVKRILNNLK